jgi:prevent-host-death family protein
MAKATFQVRASAQAGQRMRSPVTASRTFQTAEDIIPIAELKAQMSEIVRGLDERPRPLVVTLNGKPAAVVMSPREYDQLAYRARFVAAINEGLADVESGRTVDAERAFAELDDELDASSRSALTALAARAPRKPARRR